MQESLNYSGAGLSINNLTGIGFMVELFKKQL